jgi:hypothetical protein
MAAALPLTLVSLRDCGGLSYLTDRYRKNRMRWESVKVNRAQGDACILGLFHAGLDSTLLQK